MRRAGGKVRITAQLINATTEAHLWSEDYDRELKDVFTVQSGYSKTRGERAGGETRQRRPLLTHRAARHMPKYHEAVGDEGR